MTQLTKNQLNQIEKINDMEFTTPKSLDDIQTEIRILFFDMNDKYNVGKVNQYVFGEAAQKIAGSSRRKYFAECVREVAEIWV